MTVVTFTHDDVPASVNHGGGGARRHWSKGHGEKLKWEGVFGFLFLAAKLPRNLAFVRADVTLHFKGAHRRDPENYRSPVSKPLADALVKGGWLPDDNPAHFEMGTFTIADERLVVPKGSLVKARMVVTLDYRLAA